MPNGPRFYIDVDSVGEPVTILQYSVIARDFDDDDDNPEWEEEWDVDLVMYRVDDPKEYWEEWKFGNLRPSEQFLVRYGLANEKECMEFAKEACKHYE